MIGPAAPTPLFFTCPDCKRVSFNPNDVRHGYCAHCHTFPQDRKLLQGPADYTAWGDGDGEAPFTGHWVLLATVLVGAVLLVLFRGWL